jgi:hypothetical protein
MARQIPYMFCRYVIVQDEKSLSAIEEFAMLKKVRGERIAYRVRDPSKDDFDTYLLKPREKRLLNYRVHTWEIGQDVRERERTRYDRSKDETSDDLVETDEIRHTKFIGVPALGVFAVDDHFSERSLGARSAVGSRR